MQQSRPLGEQESIFHQMHGFKSLIPLQVLHIRGTLEPTRVEAALAWLQRHHPLLRAHVRYGPLALRMVPPFLVRRPFFETKGTTAVPLAVVEGHWEEVVARELQTPLAKDQSPRMRATLVHDAADAGLSHLVLFADHATIDAQSINMISRELLGYVADPQKMEAKEPVLSDLPPPLEARFPRKPSSGTRRYQSAIRVPLRPVAVGPAMTRVVSRHLEAATADALKASARARGTTLHGTITAAFLLAQGRLFGLDDLTCVSTIDLRRLCRPPLPAETYGCYVDILRTRHALQGDLWTIARDVSFKLITALAKDQEITSILKPPTLVRYATEAVPTLTHRRRLDGLAVTTAGESGLKRTYGNYGLEDVTMAVALDFFGPTMMVIASEREGRLDFSINHPVKVISSADVARIADDAVKALHDAVGATADSPAL